VAWRLVRSYELRQNETERDRYLNALDGLIPVSLDEKETDQLTKRLSALRRVAFPSILELIQRGFERLDGWEQDVALTAGLPEGKLAQRMVSLQFQHRMHPDISAFPREQFYTSEASEDEPEEDDLDGDGTDGQDEDFAELFEAALAESEDEEDPPEQLLQDARSMLAERAWKYSRYARRALWVGVDPNKGKSAGKSNRNEAEVKVVLEELQHFVEWAQDHVRRDRQGKEKPWEVAVLTYYRGQEALFRERLQHLSRQYGNTRNFQLPRGPHAVNVTLCTVDRFQGHEADIVFLSFVKSGSVGFLNSPNRLNVALTRARYQIVLVGHQAYFSSDRCPSDLLRAVATSAHYKGDIKWESQP
jgi:superfamily I DNA and/or RNA helicase